MPETTYRGPDGGTGPLSAIVRDLQLVWRLMGDQRVSLAIKVIVPVLAALYVLSPVDLLPDVIPALGQMDDLAILLLALRLFIQVAPRDVVQELRDDIAHNRAPRQAGRSSSDQEPIDGDYRVID